MTIFIKSPAKVNLYLDVIGKDPTEDYHLVSTILARVECLSDEITIEPLEGHFKVIVEVDPESKYEVPEGEDNICFRIADMLKKEAVRSSIRDDFEKKLTPVKIVIKKNIPVGAGLGGGSSNAAATLKALNKLWRLNFPLEKLKSIAAKISMDSVFFLEGYNYAYATHFGEILEPLESELKLNFEIIETGVEVLTKWAYENIDLEKCRQNKDKARSMVGALIDGDREKVLENLHNDFEYLVFEEFPELKDAAERDCEKNDSKGKILLCGSGGCLVRIS
ncbi:4-(cytidine 5'-diphospho)-2-C-methyl-D-erythritol kinase [Candidatus Peregrinibacteria bacterium]|jgi:4-diphosphocytidyl-2-C-methyl-D-erythritol kinase|nr:4-(cytidine 5'-diphospho)-2-C-methyl-D-erythritol kinase [Candidatus Peregrinibacteria bacterium]